MVEAHRLFYEENLYALAISPGDLSGDVIQMCNSFHSIYFRCIETSSLFMMKYVCLVV